MRARVYGENTECRIAAARERAAERPRISLRARVCGVERRRDEGNRLGRLRCAVEPRAWDL